MLFQGTLRQNLDRELPRWLPKVLIARKVGAIFCGKSCLCPFVLNRSKVRLLPKKSLKRRKYIPKGNAACSNGWRHVLQKLDRLARMTYCTLMLTTFSGGVVSSARASFARVASICTGICICVCKRLCTTNSCTGCCKLLPQRGTVRFEICTNRCTSSQDRCRRLPPTMYSTCCGSTCVSLDSATQLRMTPQVHPSKRQGRRCQLNLEHGSRWDLSLRDQESATS